MTLMEAFAQVKDHLRGPAVRYDLKEMIVMTICAVLCGCDDWVDVADWCEEEEGWLKTFLVLAKGTPSHERVAVFEYLGIQDRVSFLGMCYSHNLSKSM